MLARIWGYCNSAACLHQSWFQCQQFRVLQDPLLLADLYQRLELSDRPASKMNARVVIGSRVTVRQLNANDKQVFHLTIVEPSSANLQRHKISYLSPMGLALLSLPLGATFICLIGPVKVTGVLLPSTQQEIIMSKEKQKKKPQKTLKEKRREKKNKAD